MSVVNSTQVKGINKLGDVVIPGYRERGVNLPSFSQSGAVQGIDRQLVYMYASDRDAFLVLATACAYLPKFAVRGIVALASKHAAAPEPLAAVLRMANLGIKGVIHSLYYSDMSREYGAQVYGQRVSIHGQIGYNPMINEAAYEAALRQMDGGK